MSSKNKSLSLNNNSKNYTSNEYISKLFCLVSEAWICCIQASSLQKFRVASLGTSHLEQVRLWCSFSENGLGWRLSAGRASWSCFQVSSRGNRGSFFLFPSGNELLQMLLHLWACNSALWSCALKSVWVHGTSWGDHLFKMQLNRRQWVLIFYLRWSKHFKLWCKRSFNK